MNQVQPTRFFLDQGNGKMKCYCTLLAVSTVMWVTTKNFDQSRFLEMHLHSPGLDVEFVVGLGWCQNCRHVHQKVVGVLSLLMPFSFFFRYFLKPSTPQPCLLPSKLFSAWVKRRTWFLTRLQFKLVYIRGPSWNQYKPYRQSGLQTTNNYRLWMFIWTTI